MSARRKVAKPVRAWALVDSLGIDPATVAEYRSSLRLRGSCTGYRIARVEIKEITPRKLRKHSDTR